VAQAIPREKTETKTLGERLETMQRQHVETIH
jgi:hypothetical protein